MMFIGPTAPTSPQPSKAVVQTSSIFPPSIGGNGSPVLVWLKEGTLHSRKHLMQPKIQTANQAL